MAKRKASIGLEMTADLGEDVGEEEGIDLTTRKVRAEESTQEGKIETTNQTTKAKSN